MVISIFVLALKGEATIFVVLKELAKKNEARQTQRIYTNYSTQCYL